MGFFMFENKIVLITGGTSGIGEKTAEIFASKGAKIAVTGRNSVKGDELIKRLPGTGHLFACSNLRNREEAQSLIARVIEITGIIDILVNSAGVALHGTVPQTTDEAWENTMSVNLNAVFYLCRAVIPLMIQNKGGIIVNVASTWGLVGAEHSAAYCASKGALIQLTRSMAIDHAKEKVRINAVCPGAVDTPMLAAEATAFGLDIDDGKRLWASDAANNTLASTEDVASAILFLASDNAKHIHGVSLPVDGGSIA